MPKDTKEEYINEKLKEYRNYFEVNDTGGYMRGLALEIETFIRLSLSEAWDRGRENVTEKSIEAYMMGLEDGLNGDEEFRI